MTTEVFSMTSEETTDFKGLTIEQLYEEARYLLNPDKKDTATYHRKILLIMELDRRETAIIKMAQNQGNPCRTDLSKLKGIDADKILLTFFNLKGSKIYCLLKEGGVPICKAIQ